MKYQSWVVKKKKKNGFTKLYYHQCWVGHSIMYTHFGSVLKIAINKCIFLSFYKCQLDNDHYKKRTDLIFKICKVELQRMGGVIMH